MKTETNTLEVITTHINADFDAVASMLAAKKLYPDALMVFPGAQEKNLRNFFLQSTSYIFDFVRIKDVDLKKIKRLILVDTRQKRRIGKFKEIIERDDLEIHIYDHHPPSDDDIRGDFEMVKELGAGTSILTDIIRHRGIQINPEEATLMSLGIYEDTGSFTFASTKAEDHEAAAWLLQQGASINTISDMLTRDLTAEQIWLLNDLMDSATKKNINGVEVVIAKARASKYIGDFAVLVQKFMEMENLNVIFALAQMENRVYLVARSRLPEVNVADIAFEFGGGGHPQAASATITDKTLIQVEEYLNALLLSRVNFERLAKDIMTSPVIQIKPGATIKEASETLTRYNINALMVIDEQDVLKGHISRQVADRAIFLGLETRPVREYTNVEYFSARPDTSLKEIQDLIINNKIRILPVLQNGRTKGVITRTDLLNVLVERSSAPEFLYDSDESPRFVRKKNIKNLLIERLPERIITLLNSLGETADHLNWNAYLVGGLVRDVILKRENLDVDIVIEGNGIEFAGSFADKYGAETKTYPKFGTAMVIMHDGFKVDIATARTEHYESPAAPPVVELSSLKLDMFRRDFTINTLAVHLNKKHFGILIDHFGAFKDIKEKVLRVIHSLSLVEDPTRILRAIRFEQRFGFRIGKLTQRLIQNALNINCFENLSGQRFFTELKLILKEQEPLGAIEKLNEYGILKFISPEMRLTEDVRATLKNIKGVLAWFDLLYLGIPYEPWKVYFLGLTSSLNKESLGDLMERMQVQDKEIIRLSWERNRAKKALGNLSRMKGKKNYPLHTILTALSTEVLLYTVARTKSEKIKRNISIFFTKLRGTEIFLRGKDLVKLGFKPGPLFKKILDATLKAKLEGDVKTKEEEIEFIKKKFSGSHGD